MRERIKAIKVAPIGMRMIKTAVAVNICFLVNMLIGRTGAPFFATAAAVICMQPYMENSGVEAVNQIGGTLIGAFFGGLVLFIMGNSFIGRYEYLRYSFISFFVIIVIYTTVLIGKPQTSLLASVLFLSITIMYQDDRKAMAFLLNRGFETIIGIVVSLGVNAARIPRRKRRDVLFVSDLDETILGKDGSLTAFSRFELNQLIRDGANFTIATSLTPASLMDTLQDVDLVLPIITMNGAALYDVNLKKYLRLNPMDEELTRKVASALDDCGIGYFANVIVQDVLLIYVNEITNIEMQDTYQKLRRSPHRNYIYSRIPKDQKVVYFYIIDKAEVILRIADALKQQEFIDELSVVIGVEKDYASCGYLKVYHRSADRESMIEYLVKRKCLAGAITFGSMERMCDVAIKEHNDNLVVKAIKKRYEPYFWERANVR